jgi:hypothetical protein
MTFSDRFDDLPQRGLIQNPAGAGLQIELAFVDRENVFALRYAIDRKSKLTRVERYATGQPAAQSEPG